MIIRIGLFLTTYYFVPTLATASLVQSSVSDTVEHRGPQAAEGIGRKGSFINDLVVNKNHHRGARPQLHNSAHDRSRSASYTVPVRTHAPYYNRAKAVLDSDKQGQPAILNHLPIQPSRLPQESETHFATLLSRDGLLRDHVAADVTVPVSSLRPSEVAENPVSMANPIFQSQLLLNSSNGKSASQDSMLMLSPVNVYPRSYRAAGVAVTEEENTAEELQASDYSTAAISAAVALPFAALGGAAYWLYRRNRAFKAESLEMDPVDHRIDTDFDDDSLGDTTEDPFEFKFEVGNDAAMWAHQADFSAF